MPSHPVIPITTEERVQFLDDRFRDYAARLGTHRLGGPAAERAEAAAWDMATSDLRAILGREGERAYRIEFALGSSSLRNLNEMYDPLSPAGSPP